MMEKGELTMSEYEQLLMKITDLMCLVIQLSGQVDILDKKLSDNVYNIK